jgi:hypothetical protein
MSALSEVLGPNPDRAIDVLDGERLSRDPDHHPRELVDADHLLGADVDGTGEIGSHQTPDRLQTFIYV